MKLKDIKSELFDGVEIINHAVTPRVQFRINTKGSNVFHRLYYVSQCGYFDCCDGGVLTQAQFNEIIRVRQLLMEEA